MSAAIRLQASLPIACVARNSPVEMSRNAAPTFSPRAHKAARYVDSRGSNLSGNAVPIIDTIAGGLLGEGDLATQATIVLPIAVAYPTLTQVVFTFAEDVSSMLRWTIEDPSVFTRPWKISMALYRHVEKNAQILEFKCVPFAEELLYGQFKKKTGN